METVTLSVEELRQLISDEVQKAVDNSKPVKDKRMKELEVYFRDEVSNKHLGFNWYSAWTSVRTIVALKMGYRSSVRVPASKYDEFLEKIKTDIDEIINIHEKG